MEELDSEIKRIDEKIKKQPAYTDILKLYKEILKIKNKYKDILKIHFVQIDDETIQNTISNGFPVLRRDKIELDFENLEKCFLELIDLFKEKEGGLAEELSLAISQREIDFKELLTGVMKDGIEKKENGDEGKGEESLMKQSTVRLLAYEVLRPVMEFYSDSLKERIKDEQWIRGYCPVCGEKPRMAELRGEEGKRIFKCSLCSHEWSFTRVKCPFCENDKHEELGYLSVEGEDDYRINVCKKCKGYIKTIDTRDFDEDTKISLSTEDVSTLHLDILAKREGYKKENSSLFYQKEE